jgi:hypothetical protein
MPLGPLSWQCYAAGELSEFDAVYKQAIEQTARRVLFSSLRAEGLELVG